MRLAGSLAIVVGLSLCQLCCKPAGSFEAVFGEATKDSMGSGLIHTPGLSGHATGDMTSCSIQLDTQQSRHEGTDVHEFGEIHLVASEGNGDWVVPWDWIVTDQISANGVRLTGSDLRVGQRIRVNYNLARKDRDLARIEVLNYSKPTKALRLSISMVLEGEFKKSFSPESVESIVITTLSWHLPRDVAIVKSTENTAGLTPIGDLKVTYTLIASKTGYMVRAYEFRESLDVDTSLVDQTATTNWAQLRLTGGTHPGSTNDINDLSITPVLTKIPAFEMRPASSKK